MRRILSLLLAMLLVVSAVPVFAAQTGELRVGSVSGLPGREVQVPIALDDSQGLVSVLLTVDYDDRLELVKVTDSGLLPGKNHKETMSNPYTLCWENDTATENYVLHGTIATLTFRIPADAQPGESFQVSVSYDPDNYEIIDKDWNPILLTCVPGAVSVEEGPKLEFQNAPQELVGGASVTLKAVFTKNAPSTKTLVWSLRSADTAFASISSSGKLTTKAVAAKQTIVVQAASKAMPEVKAQWEIDLLPKTTSVVMTPKAGAAGFLTVNYAETNTITLNALTQPEAAKKTGTWKTSSKTIADVKDGVVTFKKPGLVTITFTASDGTKKAASVKIRAGYPVTDIDMSANVQKELVSGKKLTLKAVPNADASLKTLAWEVSNTAAASVTSKGAVTAKTVYEPTPITVTAKATDGFDAYETYDMTILPKAGVMAVREDGAVVNAKTLYRNYSEDLRVVLTADEGSTWTSSSKKIATVEDGVVTFLKAGSVTITAKNGKNSGKVTIKATRLVDDLTVSVKSGDTTLTSGKGKVTLKATPVNADATTKTVTWKSSNTAVATVSSSGVVTAKAGVPVPTDVVITATAKDGSGKSDSITVTVIPAVTTVDIVAGELLVTDDGITVAKGEVLNTRTLIFSTDQESILLDTVRYPDGASEKVTWKSSSTKIATVRADGTVEIHGVGTVTLTATAADGSAKKNTVKLKIVRPVL